ncbi:SMP-30/gluconolactonase/LRE family protein [Sphingosinithalassobacter tenebrarum]|uniref:SMP-30/gluconolactonase/LRE family protein n=2 Tax=Stakelama tenebrarum TaxID=2711215 RepID=A0A6G6YAF7_9SPHN|nr:SMP-30/gluconolactonase/LRE family protein [Sphingosinithalassobacter tenebrarum]
MEASHLLSVGAELGEGPVWIGDALWFVDIKRLHLYRHRPESGTTDRWDAPEMVGWVLPSHRGDMIVGLQSGPHRFAPDTGSFTRIATIDADLPDNRLNDAAVDARGSIFFGTMDNEETRPNGCVYLLDHGAVRKTVLDATIITNGPAVAPDCSHLFHVDTLARTITRHAIAGDGTLGPGDPFLAFSGDEGHPDGAICDSEGGVWIGFYGGWAARRYAPDGTMTDEVRFPVANVTKVALGGPDGRTAYATTARQGLDAAALEAQSLAGDVFTFPVAVAAAPLVPANS